LQRFGEIVKKARSERQITENPLLIKQVMNKNTEKNMKKITWVVKI